MDKSVTFRFLAHNIISEYIVSGDVMEKSKISYKDLIEAALNNNIKISKATKQKSVYWKNRYTYISRLSHLIIGK